MKISIHNYDPISTHYVGVKRLWSLDSVDLFHKYAGNNGTDEEDWAPRFHPMGVGTRVKRPDET